MEISKLNEKLEQFLEAEETYTNKEFAEHVKSLLPQELKVIEERDVPNYYEYQYEITTESDFGKILIGTMISKPREDEEGNVKILVYVTVRYQTKGSNKWINYTHEYWGRGFHNTHCIDSVSLDDPKLDERIKSILNNTLSIQKQNIQDLQDNDPKTMFQYAIAGDINVTQCKLLKEGSFGQLYEIAATNIYGKKVLYAGVIKNGKAKKIGVGPLLGIIEQL